MPVLLPGLIVASVAFAALTTRSQTARPAPVNLDDVRTWAFAIGEGAGGSAQLARYDLVVVDGEDTSARRVAALRRAGVIVLGYVSVGTIERGRSWFTKAAPYRLELWEDWGEWYADVRAPAFRSLLADEVAPRLLAKGFDGLFLDNVDMIESHSEQTAGMRDLVGRLGRRVHARGGVLFAQNGEASITPMLRHLDGWNREDVSSTYDFDSERYRRQSSADVRSAQAALRRIARRGLLVTATDYVAANDRAGRERSRRLACSAGALSYVSDIQLRRVPAPRPC